MIRKRRSDSLNGMYLATTRHRIRSLANDKINDDIRLLSPKQRSPPVRATAHRTRVAQFQKSPSDQTQRQARSSFSSVPVTLSGGEVAQSGQGCASFSENPRPLEGSDGACASQPKSGGIRAEGGASSSTHRRLGGWCLALGCEGEGEGAVLCYLVIRIRRERKRGNGHASRRMFQVITCLMGRIVLCGIRHLRIQDVGK